MVNGTHKHRGPPRSQALVSFYQPEPRGSQDAAVLVSGPALRRAAPARPPHPLVGRRPHLGHRLRRPVLLPPHPRPLEGALPAAGPRRPARPAPRGAVPLRQPVASLGGRRAGGLPPACLWLLAQPLVLRDVGRAVGAVVPGRRQPRDDPPLAAPGRPGVATASARPAPPG